MNGAGIQIQAGSGIDLLHQPIEFRRAENRILLQINVIKPFHQVTEDSSLRAA